MQQRIRDRFREIAVSGIGRADGARAIGVAGGGDADAVRQAVVACGGIAVGRQALLVRDAGLHRFGGRRAIGVPGVRGGHGLHRIDGAGRKCVIGGVVGNLGACGARIELVDPPVGGIGGSEDRKIAHAMRGDEGAIAAGSRAIAT